MTFKTHVFDECGWAYDKSQTGYYRFRDHIVAPESTDTIYTEVADGDLLAIPREGIYGFLYEAWPIAYVPNFEEWLTRKDSDPEHDPQSGVFQVLKDPEAFLKEYPQYKDVYEAAEGLWHMHHNESAREHLIKVLRKANEGAQ